MNNDLDAGEKKNCYHLGVNGSGALHLHECHSCKSITSIRERDPPVK